MKLSLIAAIAKNYVEGRGYPIGKDGKLPWNLPEDLKRFRELTLNHPVIMGRKTYESVGKPFENRLNIVITRNLDYKEEFENSSEISQIPLRSALNSDVQHDYSKRFKSEGVKIFHTLEAAVVCLNCKFIKQEGINYDLAYIIGGESIFKKALPIADKLEITHVDQIVENADTFFPKIGEEWKEIKREDKQGCSFVTYER